MLRDAASLATAPRRDSTLKMVNNLPLDEHIDLSPFT